MTNTRRLTLQLTPLIDLLLIVMFAQYMEVRLLAEREKEVAITEREAVSRENETLRRQVELWESQERDVDQKQHQKVEQIGALVRELFQVPESVLNKLIQPRSKNEAGGLSPAEIADLKSRFQQMAESRADEAVDYLLTFSEMRKQFDLWELYMDEEGRLQITVGQDRQRIKSKVIETPEAFVDAVLQVRRQFPPTRNSVLILCRYGDCRLLHKLSMTRGLPAIAERLNSDGQGTTHFEYAVFGYRPQPELEQK